jgi:hypothetical protein
MVVRERRVVADAMADGAWIKDIKGQISIRTFHQVLNLWEIITNIHLDPSTGDKWTWTWEAKGDYSARSVYNAHFCAAVKCSMASGIWKTWAPLKIKLFLWLVVRGRVRTNNRLAKRGLPHQDACCYCHNTQETVHHLFIGCSVVQIIWNMVLQWAGLSETVPQALPSLQDWWHNARLIVQGTKRKTLNSLVHLII